MKQRVIALVAVAVALIGVVLLWPNRSIGDGPLDDGDGLVTSVVADVDQDISFGHIMISNYGKRAATVERVRLVGVTGPLQLLGLRARDLPDPQGTFLQADGFPPSDYHTRPIADDNSVPVPKEFSPEGGPIDALQLVIGVRATAPGVARAKGVEVTYKVGDTRHREVFFNEFYLCAPKSEWGDGSECPPPALEHQFDDRVLEARL
jgi:hypothetical protein